MTTALSRYGVLGKLPPPVFAVLDLADAFRREYCAIVQERHDRLLDLRDRRFPTIFAAMTRYQTAKAVVFQVEREIKAWHAEVRDRNARTPEHESRLKAARDEATAAYAALKLARKPWFAMIVAHKRYWHSLRDWKAVKDRAKRRAAYAAIRWPTSMAQYAALPVGETQKPLDLDGLTTTAMAEYGSLLIDIDLRLRALSESYQSHGLHSTIRGEIIAASAPKEQKDKPGMRYFYGREPQPQPWKNLSVQFPGGLTLAKALVGTPQLSLSDRGDGMYEVTQQIGTKDHPALVSYTVKLGSRPIPDDAVLQRWSVSVVREKRTFQNKYGEWREKEYHRAVAVPILAAARHKPMGSGLLAYDLTCRVRKDGIEAATLYGDHVCERVVLPWRLIDERLAVRDEQARLDGLCNDLLASRGVSLSAGKRRGYWALAKYLADHSRDAEALQIYRECTLAMQVATRVMQRAVRSIEKIYELVVSRVCRLHGVLAADPIDLARLKRYDTRDLLRDDVLPAKAREYFQAAAPGKLAALLKGYGLAASGEVRPNVREDARGTDLFTSYVADWFGGQGPAAVENNTVRKTRRNTMRANELQ